LLFTEDVYRRPEVFGKTSDDFKKENKQGKLVFDKKKIKSFWGRVNKYVPENVLSGRVQPTESMKNKIRYIKLKNRMKILREEKMKRHNISQTDVDDLISEEIQEKKRIKQEEKEERKRKKRMKKNRKKRERERAKRMRNLKKKKKKRLVLDLNTLGIPRTFVGFN